VRIKKEKQRRKEKGKEKRTGKKDRGNPYKKTKENNTR
jgi:hypothetical protein